LLPAARLLRWLNRALLLLFYGIAFLRRVFELSGVMIARIIDRMVGRAVDAAKHQLVQ
jgi:hypothetical protein